MGRIKKLFMLIIMVTGLFLLAGCNIFHFDFFDGSEDKESSSIITLAPSEKAEKPAKDASKEISEKNSGDPETTPSPDATPTPAAIGPTENVELTIYTVNVSTGEPENVTAVIPAGTGITPELIVEKVVESMADRSLEVGIESVTTKGDTVIVSFYKDKAPLSEMGSGYEAAILDAIAQSLVDNLESYNKIIYRAEGGAYASGHIELGLDEVYLEDK